MQAVTDATVSRSLLEELQAAQQTLIYTVSHDLRAPLVNILGFTGEIDNSVSVLTEYLHNLDTDLPAEIDEIVSMRLPKATEFLAASTDKLQLLLDGVLCLSRALSEQYHAEAVNWSDIFTSNSAEAVVTHLVDIPPVWADRAALNDLLNHLIDNAVRFAHPDRALQVHVRAEVEPQSVTVCIEDNGKGIADRDLNEVFNLFRRSGKQTSPSYGVGLTICKSIVERMQGRIWCASDGATYTRVFVSLPIATQ